MNKNVMTIEDIKNKKRKAKKEVLENETVFPHVNDKGLPLKIWENLQPILDKHNITVKYDVVSKELKYTGISCRKREDFLQDIHSLQVKEGLNLNKNDSQDAINRIASEHSFNPFVIMLEDNVNDNISLITELFECLDINYDNCDIDLDEGYKMYCSMFTKWLLQLVHLSYNSPDKAYKGQGMLVLQGGQGTRKSTFASMLMPNKEWFKAESELLPGVRDSVEQNTKYILTELAEWETVLSKKESGDIKRFITSPFDEYRVAYGRVPEKNPRVTSFIGTINPKNFLKDETGSRRYWIIPVNKCDTEAMKKIDMCKLWGAVKHLYDEGKINYWLNDEEVKALATMNRAYNSISSNSITLDEMLDWDSSQDTWQVYNIGEIAERLKIAEKEKRNIKIELEKKGIEYKTHKVNNKPKKGFKIPRLPDGYYNY